MSEKPDVDNVEKGGTEGDVPETFGEEKHTRDLLYAVDEVPPWYLCIILGFQHYLTAFGSTISVPLILYKTFCVAEDKVGLGELINTIFFVSGLCTLLQTTFGVRLPIIQGATFAFLVPTQSILALPQWACPYTLAEKGLVNLTDYPSIGSPGHREIWHSRLREIQGAIMVASLFQVVIGFSGAVGVVLRVIGPLAVTPTVTLIGLALFPDAANLAAEQWYIALMTMFLIALFSQYLRNVTIPVCEYRRGKGCSTYKLPIFKLVPVLLAMVVAWGICAILTAAGAFPTDSGGWGYKSRTDTKISVIADAQWFRFPYPGQWGVPTVSFAGVFGMLAGVLASMMESVGDYYACARLAGAPPPPVHAVNRGIGMEGIGCILAGAWGSGNGTTSYSENVGAIGITKVGSLRVVQVGGIIMILLSCFGKFGALFVTIPDPVIGGVFMIVFGMITAVGLSNLQYVDMSSSRNIFIVGISLFFGLSFPMWMKSHGNVINTGSDVADQILTVLLSTSMLVGGVLGFVLDNTIPGTPEERGLTKWRSVDTSTSGAVAGFSVYDLPLIQPLLDRMSWPKYFPFCPKFDPSVCSCRRNVTGKNHSKDNSYQTDDQKIGTMESNVAFENDDTQL
ncbi:solute carrier family 23 member 1-like isoform X2 [Pecten maximus]|nr:solute carrier family 23 member 1-like isoform X2 [Pecten maximus]XP_033761402.1 solute carrier family 23 member 1-like isoform X2 [Pecten maximus]XP_033761403.1 solute carrier family 23 member 1-like isoform X2 [Pecten maximus]XP_033761404.1 solute carrier family 23 member 1-like isoform X2 [Pecten maximus]XP_033761405.1 solute carrier family 23 member 1-like isoform X2 [Pecten maximus]